MILKRTQSQSSRLVLFIDASIAVLLTAGLFQMLLVTWSTGSSFIVYIGGYIPWSDASWWFNGALRLLLRGRVESLGATRIVNESFDAMLLLFSNESLQLALILRTVLIAFAFFIFIREITYRLGIACAVTTAFVMMAFVGWFIPTMMSEPTAFLFGTLGATLLFLAVNDQKPRLFSAGLFLMVLALTARPGPFFVPPLLVVWSGRCFRGDKKVFATQPMLWSAAGVALAFAFSVVLARLYTPPGTIWFSNFAFILYGLAKGGQDWTVVVADFGHVPHANIAMERAIVMIKANPMRFAAGMASFARRYLKDQLIYIDQYPWSCCRIYRFAEWYRAPFVAFETIALIYSLRPRRTKIEEMCAVTFLGCVLSSALTFSEGFLTRVFAATNPLEALLAGLGARAFAQIINSRAPVLVPHRSAAKITLGLGGVLTAFLMLTPLITATGRTLSRSPEKVASWCGKDMKAMILDLGRSSPFLRIMAPGTRTFVPNVAEDKFLQDKTFGGIGIADKLGTLRQGDLLVLAYDISGFDVGDDMPLWLVVPKARFLKLPAQYRACATEESISTEWGDIPVFTARTVERVSN